MLLKRYSSKKLYRLVYLAGILPVLLASCSTTVKKTSSVTNHDYYTAKSITLKKVTPVIPLTDSSSLSTSLVKKEMDFSGLQLKYALQLEVPPSQINNISLYTFINDWLNTPYKYAGRSKNGVDCSD